MSNYGHIPPFQSISSSQFFQRTYTICIIKKENRKPRNDIDFWIQSRLRTGEPKGQVGKGAKGEGDEGDNWGGAGRIPLPCALSVAVKPTQLQERPHSVGRCSFLAEDRRSPSRKQAHMAVVRRACPDGGQMPQKFCTMGNGARVLIS